MSHTAKRRFGQNFLQDANIIARIVNAVVAHSPQQVIEIGPGQGAITQPLLENLGQLTAIEIDRDLHDYLEQRCCTLGEFRLIKQDVLKVNFTELVQSNEKLTIVGNLPYNISTPIFFHLLANCESIEAGYFMLQKEVADRICATVGTKAYGRLSIMVQYYCQTQRLFLIPPQAFNPAPKVTSAFIHLQPHQTLPHVAKDSADLEAIVTAAFNQRRKTIRNSLAKFFTAEQLTECGIDPRCRAEQLSIAEFVNLANQLK